MANEATRPAMPRDMAVERPFAPATVQTNTPHFGEPPRRERAAADFVTQLETVIREAPLNRIADQVLLLTYGDMMSLSKGLNEATPMIPEASEVASNTIDFASILHKWAMNNVAQRKTNDSDHISNT